MPVDDAAAPAAAATAAACARPAGARRGCARCRWPARPGGRRPRARRSRRGRAGAAGAGRRRGCRAAARGRPAARAKPSSGGAERHLACPAGTPRAAGPGPSPARSRPAPRAARGSDRLVGVRGGGELELAPLVGGVHRAPLAQPGHHELRDQRHGQVDVERLGEQLAGLGEEGQPGLPAQVGAAQPVVLQVAARAARRPGWPAAGRTPTGERVQLQLARRTAGCTVSGTRHASRRRSRGARPYRASSLPARRRRRGRAGPRRRPRRSAGRAGRAGRVREVGEAARRRARPGSICSSAVSAPTLGAARVAGGRPGGTSGRTSCRRAAGPAGTTRPCRSASWMVPQRLAKWSTSSRPRPRSATSPMSDGLVAAGRPRAARPGPAAKSVTVTVSPAGSAVTSMSRSVPACTTRVGGQLGGQQQRLVEQVGPARPPRAPSGPAPGRRRACAGRWAAGRAARAGSARWSGAAGIGGHAMHPPPIGPDVAQSRTSHLTGGRRDDVMGLERPMPVSPRDHADSE